MIPGNFDRSLWYYLMGTVGLVCLLYLKFVHIKLEAQSTQCVAGLLFGLIVLATLIASTD